ncbi:hypothetical protein GWC77_26475 [Paraburkholderia sp. NMBU_R16]|uniref:hypothetical protein n=1 Tax=Paraburkholderia sp. NMBU_R16 TaxID=2698676 RepID=UPI0015666496|nr:hypothetical protein [Paraburkholderia sp. NMBU_R16]NRO99430.1 hypothetical protein [Paraburkholderia sp. NMBU_R16]
MRLTPDTFPPFRNAQFTGKMQKVGSGECNSTYSMQLRHPGRGDIDVVFKPLSKTERGWVAEATGIPRDEPQIAMRNLATLAYAKKLGLNVVADTRVTVLSPVPGQHVLGLTMERAAGHSAAKADASIFGRPHVCAEVTKLQLLDHLTGQGDRHGNNYFINIEPDGRAKVTGIDNDQCFGKLLTDPNGIQWVPDDDLRAGFRGTALPPVVDIETADKIERLTPDDIRAMLQNKLSEDEIQAAIARHKGVKDHIGTLRSQGRIISADQWGNPSVQRLMNAQNSYVARDRDYALAEQAANAIW